LPDFLVTGTDTGVGKTVIAAALILALRERGIRAVGFKPVETGAEPGETTDSELLALASGAAAPLAAPILRLAEALAPAVAAERGGTALDPAVVDARVRELRAQGYALVVEGAGGVHVPLAWGYTAMDLAARHGLEAVIVARAGLGTLNHSVLTVDALRARGILVRGVVLNGRADPPSVAEQTNPAALLRLLPDVPVVVVPRSASSDRLTMARECVPFLDPLLQSP
jgi:dethiobiotin synthetase